MLEQFASNADCKKKIISLLSPCSCFPWRHHLTVQAASGIKSEYMGSATYVVSPAEANARLLWAERLK